MFDLFSIYMLLPIHQDIDHGSKLKQHLGAAINSLFHLLHDLHFLWSEYKKRTNLEPFWRELSIV